MDNPIIYSIISVSIVSLVALAGIAVIMFTSKFINRIVALLVSLAAGTLLGDVFFHILPELSEKYAFDQKVSLAIILGILFFFLLEHILDWRHCHEETCEDHLHPVAVNNIIADGLHNLVDGVIIGASFELSTSLGIATTVAVLLHEIPQEIGDFGVLVSAGFSKKKALLFNLLSACLAFIGLFFVFLLGDTIEDFVYFLLAFSAGGFIYISMSDLMPTIKHEMDFRRRFMQLFFVVLGIAIMYIFSLFE